MQPNQEQLKRFWEKCGFRFVEPQYCEHCKRQEPPYILKAGIGKRLWWDDIPLTLDNLFKYGVAKARDLSETNTLQDIEFHYQGINVSDMVECNLIFDDEESVAVDKNPVLALFYALDKVLEG